MHTDKYSLRYRDSKHINMRISHSVDNGESVVYFLHLSVKFVELLHSQFEVDYLALFLYIIEGCTYRTG